MKQYNKPHDTVFRTLFESMGDPAFLVRQGKIIDCNHAALQVLGYPDPARLLNRQPCEISPSFQPDGTSSTEKEVLMIDTAVKNGSHHFEWTYLRADGSPILVEVKLTVMVIDGEQLIYFLWRDLSARIQAEHALRKSEARFRSLYGPPMMQYCFLIMKLFLTAIWQGQGFLAVSRLMNCKVCILASFHHLPSLVAALQ